MKKRLKFISARHLADEAGQALILVLIFLLLGSLTLVPALDHIGTALKTGRAYENKTDEFYAADAGVDDAIWQVKYNGLEALFESPNFNYIFSTNASYTLDNPVNGFTTNVTIGNVWIPSNVTLQELSLTPAQAKAIIERPITDNTTNRLVVAGTPLDEHDYRIKIEFYPAVGVTENLSVSSVGIWIPQGFTYDGDCNMATFAGTHNKYEETVEARPGGQAVVWDFSQEPIPFPDLPPEELDPADFPQTAEITFTYNNSNPAARPNAIAWIVTDGPLSSDIPISWDIDTRFYKITSMAGHTEVEAYASRCEMRDMYVATPGDYVAIGNSLMTDDNHDSSNLRETWHASSTTTLSSLPNDAYISHAYLYWSGFFKSGFSAAFWGPETCTSSSITNNWTNTNPSTVWQYNNYRFRGHFTTGTHAEAARYLTMKNCFNLSSHAAGKTILEWEQSSDGTLETSDALKFQISSDNGTHWSDYITASTGEIGDSIYYYYIIPEDYLKPQFRMRFYLDGFSGGTGGHGDPYEYCYVDNIAFAQITGTADTTADFTIDGYDVLTKWPVNALQSQLIGNKYKGQYSYACWQDVTDLVRAHSDRNAANEPIGNAEYTVGNVLADESDAPGGPYYLAYCGWSLVIIYHSSDTAGRQLYLWNNFAYSQGGENLDFDNDGSPGGTITGFIVPERIGNEPEAAKLTCFVGEGDECYSGDTIKFNGTPLWDGTNSPATSSSPWLPNNASSPYNVWNSKSVGMSKDGVDIDTFSVPWGVLNADDNEAQIDLITQTDNFNLIYIILSVRSKTIIGGTQHYVISGN
jgi:hypothetical protein